MWWFVGLENRHERQKTTWRRFTPCDACSGLRNIANDPDSYVTPTCGPGPAYNTRGGLNYALPSKPSFVLGKKLYHGSYLQSSQYGATVPRK